MNNAKRKPVILGILCLPILLVNFSSAQEEQYPYFSEIQASVMGGYYNGANSAVTWGYWNPYIRGLLIEVEGGLTLTEQKGSANTPYSGPYFGPVREPKESGEILDMGMNIGYLLTPPAAPAKLLVFGGPRFTFYQVDYQYPGYNNGFNVEARSWGMGTGLRGTLRLSRVIDGILQVGVDYYFPSSPYSVNNSISANYPLPDLREADALSRANLPRFRPRVMIGIQFP